MEYTEERIMEIAGELGFNHSETFTDLLDTPLQPLIDVAGGISLSAYKRLCEWSMRAAVRHPESSALLRMVFVFEGER